MPRSGKGAGSQARAARGERKRTYLDRAKALFAQFGYAGTTYEQIVEAAGVSRSVLAKSYPDKPDFLRAVGEDWLNAIFPPAETDGPLGGDVVGRLQDFTERFLTVMSTDRHAASIVLAGLAEPGDPEESAIVHQFVRAAVDRLAPIVQEGQQAAVIRRDLAPFQTAADWMRFLLGAALLPPLESEQGDPYPHIIETLLHGVLKTDV